MIENGGIRMKRVIAIWLAIICCFTIFALTLPTSADALSSTPLVYQSNAGTHRTNALYKGILGAMSVLLMGIITLPFRIISNIISKKKRKKQGLRKNLKMLP